MRPHAYPVLTLLRKQFTGPKPAGMDKFKTLLRDALVTLSLYNRERSWTQKLSLNLCLEPASKHH